MKLFKIITAVSAMAVLVGCNEQKTQTQSASDPEQTAGSFVQCAYEGNDECVFNLISLEGVFKNHPEELKSLLKEMTDKAQAQAKQSGGVKELIVSPAAYGTDKKTALVNVTAKFVNADAPSVSIKLKSCDDKWLVALDQ